MNKVLLVALTLLISLSSCSLSPDGEVLYLKTGSSYLPIYVRGNPNSDTYLIWVHGGPGSSGLYYGNMDEVKQLHKKYKVVYWDQLSSGGTVGNPSTSEFTIDEFSTHVQGIANIIKKKYKPRNLYLVGHSWGGLLSGYFLTGNKNPTQAQKNQAQFNGFIGVNPVFDMQSAISKGIEFMQSYAQQQIAQGNSTKYWQDALNWYNSLNGNLEGENVAKHFGYLLEAGGMVVNKDRLNQIIKQETLNMAFLSPFEFYSYFDNQKAVRTYLRVENCSIARSTEANISLINIPTIILAGQKDKVAFPEDSIKWQQMLSNGKSNPQQFSIEMFQNSAHSIFIDEPQKFISTIDNFINTYNK